MRWPLRRIPPDTQVRILRGPARGLRWVAGSGALGYWVGNYEAAKAGLFASRISRGMVVYDVGAQAGYYSLIAAHKGAQVVAFEPLAQNLSYLRRNLAINGLPVSVVHAAVGLGGVGFFEEGSNPFTGHIGKHGIEVQVVALDDLDLPAANLLKIDVEGAEVEVLQGAQRLLSIHHPEILLATHSATLQQKCLDILDAHGYCVTLLDQHELFASQDVSV